MLFSGMNCSYGCGTKAYYQLKNGRWCCSESTSSCSGMKERNRSGKVGVSPNWKNGHPRGMLGKVSPLRGKSFVTIYGKKRAAEVARKISDSLIGVSTGKASNPKLELDRRKKISSSMRNHGGGHREGSGRGIKGWYKKYWCDSSWELAYVIWCLDHKIKITRNTESFRYKFRGRWFDYFPDFVRKGTYIEIKGYWTSQTSAKVRYFPKKLIVLDKHSMQPILKYVVNTYGSDFTRLYE